MTHQPTEASAAESVSTMRNWLKGSISAPPQSRGMVMRKAPACWSASTMESGSRRSRSISSRLSMICGTSAATERSVEVKLWHIVAGASGNLTVFVREMWVLEPEINPSSQKRQRSTKMSKDENQVRTSLEQAAVQQFHG